MQPAEVDMAIVDEVEPEVAQPPKKARGKFAKRIARRTDARRRVARRGAQWLLQNDGMSRLEARRTVFGPTRREATSHPTRGQLLIQQSAAYRARKRWRRRQQVAAAIATAEASW